MLTKFRYLHPLFILYYWKLKEDLRYFAFTKDGSRTLGKNLLILLVVLGAISGFIYWGAIQFRFTVDNLGMIDTVRIFYYYFSFLTIGILSLLLGAAGMAASTLEEEKDRFLYSLPLTHRNISLYKGHNSLWEGFYLPFFIGFWFLLFGFIALREGFGSFLISIFILLLLTTIFVLWGNLFMGFLVSFVPPGHREKTMVFLAVLAVVILIVSVAYFARFWRIDIIKEVERLLPYINSPYLPTTWATRLFFYLQEKGFIVKESLTEFARLGGVIILSWVSLLSLYPIVYRLEKSPDSSSDLTLPSTVRFDSKVVTLLINWLPLDRYSKTFLKKDIILALRNPALLIRTLLLLGSITVVLFLGIKWSPFWLLLLLYYAPVELTADLLPPSLKSDGANLDSLNVLLQSKRFIIGKVVAYSLLAFFLTFLFFLTIHVLFPTLRGELRDYIIRLSLVSVVSFKATLLCLVTGRDFLFTGKTAMNQTLVYYTFGFVLTSGFTLLDMFISGIPIPILPGIALKYMPCALFLILPGFLIFLICKTLSLIEDIKRRD